MQKKPNQSMRKSTTNTTANVFMSNTLCRLCCACILMLISVPAFAQLPKAPLPFAKDTTVFDKSATALINPLEYYLDGLKAMQEEDYTLAQDFFSMAQMIEPNSPGLNYSIAELNLRMGDLTAAAYHAQLAIDQDPENKWTYLLTATIHQAAGQTDLAVDALELAVTVAPNDVSLLQDLGDLLAANKEYKKSNEVLSKLITLDGELSAYYYKKYRNFINLNQPDSSIHMLEKMHDLEPNDSETLQALSQFYIQQGQETKALELLNEALELNQLDISTVLLISDLQLDKKQYDAAGELIFKTLRKKELNSQDKLKLVRFFILHTEDDPTNVEIKHLADKSIKIMTEELKDDPNATAFAADYYVATNQADKAITYLGKAVKQNPKNDIAWRQYLQSLYSAGQYDEVIHFGKEANKHVPEDAFIQFFVGSSFQLQGMEKKALSWFENASKVPTEKNLRSIIFTSLADCYASLKDWEQAFKAYDRAIYYDTKNDNALNNYAYYLSVQNIQLDKAESMALRANEIRAGVASYLDTLGWIYYQRSKYELAKKWILKAIDTGDASATVMEHLGTTYKALGDIENAKVWWQKALDADPNKTHLKSRLSE